MTVFTLYVITHVMEEPNLYTDNNQVGIYHVYNDRQDIGVINLGDGSAKKISSGIDFI